MERPCKEPENAAFVAAETLYQTKIEKGYPYHAVFYGMARSMWRRN
jgi:hypothetical protein